MRLLRRREKRSYSERNVVPLGIVGTAVAVVLLLLALNISHVPFLSGGRDYSAAFAEAGGLSAGDDVLVSGLPVGSVSSIDLDHDHVKIGFTVTDDNVTLGDRTSAAIVTETVLGKKALQLTSAGSGRLGSSTIPIKRTTPAYDITQALAGLTTRVQDIDTTRLAKSLDTISTTFENTPAALKATITSLRRVSTTISSRDAALQTLLSSANSVTSVLAQRDSKITLLLADGTKLLAELNNRRDAIVGLLRNVTAVSEQLTGLVDDNNTTLKPALAEINQVVTLLNNNKKNLESALGNLGPFATSLGEVVGSGPFFDAYVQNLTTPTSLVPVLSGLAGK